MKNIQIIDGADNCVYDIYAASEEQFNLIFPNGTNIAFIDEVYAREDENEHKKQFYPDRTDEGALNPGGTKLRP